jgi:heptosyltransferase-2
MVMAQSLFKLLKARDPRVEIDVVAPAWTAPLLARMPEVRETMSLSLGHGDLGVGVRWRLGRELRTRTYDQAIVLPNSLKSALVPFAAHARVRTGYIGEWRFGLLNDARRLDKKRLPQTVQRFIALGLPPDAPMPVVSEPRLIADRDNAAQALARLGQAEPKAPLLALCPGAEYGPAKRWPAPYFAEVAQRKLAEGWEVWLFGSHKDEAITREIQALTQNRCVDLGGRTALGEVIDLLAFADAVVTNDSGLMHVAAALARPVIALFGSSDPHHTPPLSARAQVLSLNLACSPCFKRVCPLGHTRCLTDLQPAQVLAALGSAS